MSRFENKVQIWEGNFSKTYLAYDRNISKNVVLKEFPKKNKDLSQTEYLFLSKIRYKTPEVYDMFESDEYVYIVREYIPGKTLREIVEEKGKLPPQLALFIASEILRFLDFIDSKGEFNGDITPSNIIIGFDGQVKILDCAKSQDVITPGYYDRNSKKDIVSDLKALGKVIEYMCPGVFRDISEKAYSRPRDFILDIAKKIYEFGPFFEREASLFITTGNIINSGSRTGNLSKGIILVLSISIPSFLAGLILPDILRKRLDFSTRNTEVKKETYVNPLSQNIEMVSLIPGERRQVHEKVEEKSQETEKIRDSRKPEQSKKDFKSMFHPTEKNKNTENFGYIFINSLPDSEVYLDGKMVDRTPVVNLKVQEGYHFVEFRNNLTSYRTKIDVQNSEKIFIFADLTNMRVEIKREISK